MIGLLLPLLYKNHVFIHKIHNHPVYLLQVRRRVTQCVNVVPLVISPTATPPPSPVSPTETAPIEAWRHWDGARPLQTASVALSLQHWSAPSITLCATLVRHTLCSRVNGNLMGGCRTNAGLESGVEIVCTVCTPHTHIQTCDDAFEQTSIVNNLKSASAELFRTCGHFHSWRQGISSVRFVVQIPFFSKFLRVWKPTQERKAKAKRDEWDVYTPTVIMTHDGSITPLTVTSSNYNNRGNWVKHTETQDELVSLCYSDVNYDTCWQLILEGKPQIWLNSQSLRNHSRCRTHTCSRTEPGTLVHAVCDASRETHRAVVPQGGWCSPQTFIHKLSSCGLHNHRVSAADPGTV